jgi:hypothetical protein
VPQTTCLNERPSVANSEGNQTCISDKLRRGRAEKGDEERSSGPKSKHQRRMFVNTLERCMSWITIAST